MNDTIRDVLMKTRKRSLSIESAYRKLKDLPYADLGFAKVDHHRHVRRGFPEVVFGQGKTVAQIVQIAKKIIAGSGVLLVTRVDADVYRRVRRAIPKARYDRCARIIWYRERPAQKSLGKVLIVTAGTADLPVAEEARVTLEVMGQRVETLFDVGVAGIHRVIGKRALLASAGVIIVVAGMEGALASVVSGLVQAPVIAVPTSVGYGASFKGIAPLLTMLNSCSPGVAVVNIDNGFGAGYLASLINR